MFSLVIMVVKFYTVFNNKLYILILLILVNLLVNKITYDAIYPSYVPTTIITLKKEVVLI